MKIIFHFIDKINNLDSKIKTLVQIGIKFSSILCLFAVLILSIYKTMNNMPNIFYIGISLLHSSLMFACAFIIFGIGFDTIKNQLEN